MRKTRLAKKEHMPAPGGNIEPIPEDLEHHAPGNAKKWITTHWGISLVLAGFTLWRLYFLTRNHDIIWDEAVYLGIGKFLWSAGASGLFEIIRPIGLPLLLGAIWKTGLDPIFWGEILAIAFSAGTLYLVFRIGEEIHSSFAGIIAALMTALTPTFFLYSGYLMTDIPSTFFMLASLLLFISKRFGQSGCMASIAFLFRYPHGIFMAAAAATLLFYYLRTRTQPIQSREHLLHAKRFFIPFFLLPALFMIANWILYHTETSKAWHAIFRPWILASWHAGNPAEAAGGWMYYLNGIIADNIFFAMIILGLAWFVIRKEYQQQEHTLPWIALLLYALYFSAIINKQMRFSIAFLPLLSILSAKGLSHTIEWLGFEPTRQKTLRGLTLIAILAFGGLFLYPEDMKFYGWRHAEAPPLVREVYQFFDREQITLPVLTSDPLPAAYSDKRFEPFYFSVDSSARIYEQFVNTSWGVLFVPEAFYCAKEDTPCKEGLNSLQKKIEKDHQLVLEKRYGQEDLGFRTYQIWKKRQP